MNNIVNNHKRKELKNRQPNKLKRWRDLHNKFNKELQFKKKDL